MDQEQISRLLDKYLAGACTPEEEQAVHEWLKSRHYDQSQWQRMSGQAQQEFLDALYRDVRQSINVKKPAPDRRSIRMTLRIAAVGLVLLGAALLYLVTSRNDKAEELTIATTTGTKKATLPDGSVVILNASSQLRYKQSWKAREVELSGEAYFDVQPNSDRPFVIRSGAVRTRVLGTSFNIQAYPAERRIAVSVISGKVALTGEKSEEKILLEKGQAGIYDREDHRITQVRTEGDSPAAWTEGKLNFFHMTLEEVAAVLERTYNIRISIKNDRTRKCEITGRFHINQSPAEILEVICKTIDATYKIEGENITIDQPAGCGR